MYQTQMILLVVMENGNAGLQIIVFRQIIFVMVQKTTIIVIVQKIVLKELMNYIKMLWNDIIFHNRCFKNSRFYKYFHVSGSCFVTSLIKIIVFVSPATVLRRGVLIRGVSIIGVLNRGVSIIGVLNRGVLIRIPSY